MNGINFTLILPDELILHILYFMNPHTLPVEKIIHISNNVPSSVPLALFQRLSILV